MLVGQKTYTVGDPINIKLVGSSYGVFVSVLRYNNCIILKAFYSDFAKGNYSIPPQWKPVVKNGNIRDINSEQELLEWHKEMLGEDGKFRILARDFKGHFANAGSYIVSNNCGKLEFHDYRKSLPRKFKRYKERVEKSDFLILPRERGESVPSPM